MSSSNECKLLKDLRVADLKLELEKRGQATSGVKAVLVERLQSSLKEEGEDVLIFGNRQSKEVVNSIDPMPCKQQQHDDLEKQ